MGRSFYVGVCVRTIENTLEKFIRFNQRAEILIKRYFSIWDRIKCCSFWKIATLDSDQKMCGYFDSNHIEVPKNI